ncbi:MAG: hypothetical protein JWN13_1476, partial [Betaproteobacteria bacterium]|nr:hypothetical protein [Betaproteobacteria bacterium]
MIGNSPPALKYAISSCVSRRQVTGTALRVPFVRVISSVNVQRGDKP